MTTASLPVAALDRRGRRLALPVLLLVLAVIGLAALMPAAVEGDAMRAEIAGQVERVIAYALTPDHGPRFRLPGGPELVRVTAHLVLPQAGPYAPNRRYAFGLSASLRAPDGELLWARHMSERTGQTKAGLVRGAWAYEAAFVADRRYELSDSAGLELALPDCPPGSTLELRLSPEAGLLSQDGDAVIRPFAAPTALVRLHRRVDLDVAGESLRRSATAAALGKARLAAATFLPWHALRELHRAHAAAEAWERMPAEGRAGVDYRGESVYVAAGPPPAPTPPEPPAIAIASGQGAVVHLIGPGQAIVRARSGEPMSTGAPQAIQLRARWLGPFPASFSDHVPDDMNKGSEMSMPIDDAWQEQAIALPAGWTSLEMTTDVVGAEVQVLAADGARHATAIGPWTAPGAAAPLPAETAAVACAGAPLTYRSACSLAAPPPSPSSLVPVDLRTLPLYSVGPSVPPMPFSLAGPPDLYTRTLRLDVRGLGDASPVRLRVEYLDARGRTIADDELFAEPVNPALFDRVRAPSVFVTTAEEAAEDGHAPQLISALGLPLAERVVSEPASLRLLAPPEAVRLQLSADRPALLDVRGVLPPPAEEVGDPWVWPYDQVSIEGERWRYAPSRRDRWFPLRSEDHAARLQAGHVLPLQAQIRREPTGLGPGLDGPWVTLSPRGGQPRLDVLELIPAARRAEAIAHWGPGDVSLLRPGVLERIDLRRGGLGPALLRYHALGEHTRALGQDIALRLGERDSLWRVTARAELRRLKRPVGGLLSLTWSSGPEPLRLFVNRPTSSAAPIYTHRQLHRLGPRPLTVDVPRRRAEAETLHVVVYWLASAAQASTTLRVQIDGGAPTRHGARGSLATSQGERTLVLVPDAGAELIRADRDDPVRVQRTTFSIRLGDDLAPGRHTVTVTRTGGPPVWLRIYRAARPARGQPLEDRHED